MGRSLVVFCASSAAIVFAAAAFLVTPVFAQVSTSSPNQLGFRCDSFGENFVEGNYYDQIFNNSTWCTFAVSDLPSTRHYGGVFRGIVGNSSGGGNSLGSATIATVRTPTFENLQQGEPMFGAVWGNRTGPAFDDHTQFLNFFRNGSIAPPTDNW